MNKRMNTAPLMPAMCATCPFREGVAKKYSQLRATLSVSALREASRICHSTGKDNAFHADTGKPERLCRGARDLQLTYFHRIGFIAAATDEAWAAKCRELGLL